MQINRPKAKIHRATITRLEFDYQGPCAVDEALLKASDIREYKQIHVYDISSGQPLITYAIRSERDCGLVSVKGAAAAKASVGDLIIIAAFASMDVEEADQLQPRLSLPGNQQSRREHGQRPCGTGRMMISDVV